MLATSRDKAANPLNFDELIEIHNFVYQRNPEGLVESISIHPDGQDLDDDDDVSAINLDRLDIEFLFESTTTPSKRFTQSGGDLQTKAETFFRLRCRLRVGSLLQ